MPPVRRLRVPAVLTLLVLLAGTPAALAAYPPGWQESRAEQWRQERQEKAEALDPPELNVVEHVLVAVERSLDEGLLGRAFLGVKVYQWLVMLGVLLASGATAYWFHRRRRRTRRSDAAPT